MVDLGGYSVKKDSRWTKNYQDEDNERQTQDKMTVSAVTAVSKG